MVSNDIKLIVLDVDGVLTDGRLLIGSNGIELKSFHVKDGMGISIARFSGIKVAIITGRQSEAVNIRARELHIDFLYTGITNKVKILTEIISGLDIEFHNVFYMGDDINDLPVMRLVGFSAAPFDAVEPVKKTVNFISKSNGGNGAVREAIDYILAQKRDYCLLLEEYLEGKDGITQ